MGDIGALRSSGILHLDGGDTASGTSESSSDVTLSSSRGSIAVASDTETSELSHVFGEDTDEGEDAVAELSTLARKGRLVNKRRESVLIMKSSILSVETPKTTRMKIP